MITFCSMFRHLRVLSQRCWSFNIQAIFLWLGTMQVTLEMLEWSIERLSIW